MRRIDKIKPYKESKSILIEDLKSDYFKALKNSGNTNPKKKIKKAIEDKKLYDFDLKTNHIKFLEYLKNKYDDELITGDPVTLNIIKKHIKTKGWQSLVYKNKKKTDFGDALLTAFGYESRFRRVPEKGLWYAKKLNIKSCPYCNAQYTLYVDKDLSEGIAKFQFDHFYPKERYPYFSVSMHNLIPSCASCNLTKSNEEMDIKNHFHPYYNSLDLVSEFYVNYPDKVETWTFEKIRDLKPGDLEVEFRSKYSTTEDFVDKHDELYHINAVYSRHLDICHELLVKSILCNRFYKKGTRTIKGLFPDEKTLLRYVLGNYMTSDQINERPLSKLTQDLAKQLKLLK